MKAESLFQKIHLWTIMSLSTILDAKAKKLMERIIKLKEG